jgi:hypothetical protein
MWAREPHAAQATVAWIMTLRMSWTTVLLLSAVVVLAGLVVAHTIGFYVQVLVFALALIAVLAFMARRGLRRATTAVRTRMRTPPD